MLIGRTPRYRHRHDIQRRTEIIIMRGRFLQTQLPDVVYFKESPSLTLNMLANDDPAGTLRYEEKPVYTTSNGCPVNGSLHSVPSHASLVRTNV